MERRKRRQTYHRFDEPPRPRNYIEEAEQARPEYSEEELRPIRGKEKEQTLYFHECKKMGYVIITNNKEPCRFCGTIEMKIYGT